MRRSLALARATRRSIQAEKLMYDARIDETEEYLGWLRRKRDILDIRAQDATEQIGDVRDEMDLAMTPECSISSDEDEEDIMHAEAVRLPPSSDNIVSSDVSSDEDEEDIRHAEAAQLPTSSDNIVPSDVPLDEDKQDIRHAEAVQLPTSSDNIVPSDYSSSASTEDSAHFPVTTSPHPSEDAAIVANAADSWMPVTYPPIYERCSHETNHVVREAT